MARDELDRLERRWRARPMFRPRRRRLPRWPLALLLAALVAALVWRQPTAGLIERVQRALVAGGVGAPPQASPGPGGAGAGDAGGTQAQGTQRGEQGEERD
jgi:hypothetical protein